MNQSCHLRLPVQRLGLAYPTLEPADATRFLRMLLRPLLVVLLLALLGWGLVVASQTISRVSTGAIAPIVSAPMENRATVSERDLQSQVDAFLSAEMPDRNERLP